MSLYIDLYLSVFSDSGSVVEGVQFVPGLLNFVRVSEGRSARRSQIGVVSESV